MLLEICVDNFQSALNAQNGGADRIELCAALSEDGLTPSYGFAKQCIEALSVEVFPMIRPRQGNFVYTKAELQIMLEDIRQFKAMGVHGVVFGVLNDLNEIDEIATRRLINAARPLPVTFHRAFDYTTDPLKALDQLISLKVDRLLTSGQGASATEGLDTLKELVQQSRNQIIIMPGAGLNSTNIHQLMTSGAQEYHGSARPAGSDITDEKEVKKIKSMLL